jgi:hypothetical protein
VAVFKVEFGKAKIMGIDAVVVDFSMSFKAVMAASKAEVLS